MPTYSQLQAEVYWGREIIPPTIAAVSEAIRNHFGIVPAAMGVKGDNNHLSGGHRTPEWIINSRYSTRGSGDGSLLCSDGRTLKPGHPQYEAFKRNLRALDCNPGSVNRMVEMCKRINAAIRANRLPNVRRFWGNVDGDQIVDGFDNLYDRATTSDSSHLWHWHVEWYPDRAHLDHGDFFSVILGQTSIGGDDMDANQAQQLTNIHDWLMAFFNGKVTGAWPHSTGALPKITPNERLDVLIAASAAETARDAVTRAALDALMAAVHAGGGSIDAAPILAKIEEVAAQERSAVTALQSQIATMQAELDDYRNAELEAAQERVNKLDGDPTT